MKIMEGGGGARGGLNEARQGVKGKLPIILACKKDKNGWSLNPTLYGAKNARNIFL